MDIKNRIGKYPPLNSELLYPYLNHAIQAVADLNSITKTIPNTSLFIYMYVRKEALLSSQIEGTQSSFSDLILFEQHEKPSVSLSDVEEVSNYVAAINYGLKRLKEGFPLSLRLLREIHAVLLKGVRGKQSAPGEFRRSQNWIGGSRPGNALFVPPPPEYLKECLNDFETFLYDEAITYHILIKAGLAHVQFETIHPFLDGNGRLGRLLIIFMLCESEFLYAPILYVSLYLKQNRTTYYNLLQEVRLHGTWETWLEFFLKAIKESACQGIATAQKITALFEKDHAAIITHLKRATGSATAVFEYLKKLPQVSVSVLARELSLSAPTIRASLTHLSHLGIVQEISGKKRDRFYVYKKYLDILEEDTQPL